MLVAALGRPAAAAACLSLRSARLSRSFSALSALAEALQAEKPDEALADALRDATVTAEAGRCVLSLGSDTVALLAVGEMPGGTHALHSLALAPELPCGPASAPALRLLISGVEGAKRSALVRLPGLCAAVAAMDEAALAEEFGDDAAGAVVAVANGRPRPGHSVLGQGTFKAAAPCWVSLAGDFTRTDAAAAGELGLWRAAGARDAGVSFLAETDPEAIRDSGGTLAILSLPESL